LKEDIFHYILLNTIKSREETGGLKANELKEIVNIPQSRLYRVLKKLEEASLLNKLEDHGGVGRPTNRYFLTKLGDEKLLELKQRFSEILKFLLKRSNIHARDFDIDIFVKNLVFRNTGFFLDQILENKMPIEQKIRILEKIEERLTKFLGYIKKKKEQLIVEEK